MSELQKRLQIIDNLFSYFHKDIFEGILLTGSMVHKKIHNDSDIDLLFIIKKENIDLLNKEDFFVNSKYFVNEKLELLKKNILFWCDQELDSIKINMGFCTLEYFSKFCNLEAKYWSGSREHDKLQSSKIKDLNNNLIDESIKIKKNKNLFVWTYNNFHNNVVLSRPFFSNIISSKILYDYKGVITKNIILLENKLMQSYGIEKVIILLEYVFNKCSEKYKQEIISKLNKNRPRK